MTTVSQPHTATVEVPRMLNVAVEHIDGPIATGHGPRTAYICDGRQLSYWQLRQQVNQVANVLAELGVEMEQRVAILLPNQPEFVTAFFGAIKLGAVAAPISTAITPADQAFLLADCRARALVVTEALWAPLRARLHELPSLRAILVVGPGAHAPAEHDFLTLVEAAGTECETAPTTCDDVAFWLHTSGSTGTPKWAMHLQRNPLYAEQLYAAPIVGLQPGDRVLSAGPCFHAYPLGLTTYFPLRAGATVVLNSERPTPARIFDLIEAHGITVFVGVPTLYAQMLQAAASGAQQLSSVRICLSAAEPLPAELYRRWQERFGVEILDGIGTTEALHVFISNRQGHVRAGSSGTAVDGYEVRLLDEQGGEVGQGEIGNLAVKGGSIFAGYWHQQAVSQRTLQGAWYHTGDKYSRDADGFYWYRGRADDMLRVSGHWVSPAEVESALMEHPSVLEAAVVGKADVDELIKPLAFVIVRAGVEPSGSLVQELQAHVKATIAPYNYPRWIEFVAELPKTATGKIQRYKLRR